jgi:hypothetical protein
MSKDIDSIPNARPDRKIQSVHSKIHSLNLSGVSGRLAFHQCILHNTNGGASSSEFQFSVAACMVSARNAMEFRD